MKIFKSTQNMFDMMLFTFTLDIQRGK